MSEEQKQPETIIENSQQPVEISEDSVETKEKVDPVVNNQPESSQELNEVAIDSESEPTPVEVISTETTESVSNLTDKNELEIVIETLQQENAALNSKLDTQIKQTEQIKAQFVRNVADFENFRKRTEKEKEELEYQIKRKTISELLSVIDNFERARTQIKPSNEGEMGIHKSYQGVYRLLVDSLKRIGVSAMRPEGELFDPNLHEAVMQQETNEHPEGTILEQLQRGYLLGDKVLRHAMVKVASPSENTTNPEEETTATVESENVAEEN